MNFISKNLKLTLQKWFDFSEIEIKGFVFVLLILCLILTVPFIYGKLTLKEDHFFSKKDQRTLDSIAILFSNNEYNNSNNGISAEKFTVKRTLFDPNIASKAELVRLGFKDHIADRILKFRTKVGKFKIKSDLQKIYGIAPEQYKELQSFIDLPDSIAPKKSVYGKSAMQNNGYKPVEKVDINLADSMQLEKIYGIGFKTANRIIKYRERLGGFIDMNQLSEVWGLDSTVIKELNKKTFISEDYKPTKIDVNTADLNLLKNQPYIGYKFGKVIISYRDQRGKILHIDQLKDIKILTEVDILRMQPYLEFK